MRTIQVENDSLQQKVLETNEEIQEKRRHVREIEVKLNTTLKESQGRSEQVSEFEANLKTLQEKLTQV